MRLMLVVSVLLLSALVGMWIYLVQSGNGDDPIAVASDAQSVGSAKTARDGAVGDVETARPGPVSSLPGAFESDAQFGASAANRFEDGEILVANPPEAFRDIVEGLGYRTVEVLVLRQLDLTVHRMRVPPDVGVPDALLDLRRRFPGVVIDVNHQYQPSQAMRFGDSHARQLIGWQSVPAACGSAVRIGMIDAGVDVEHPALNGVGVDYRTFNRADRKPGPADHGTAVASIMVGSNSGGQGWGGLLPGAALFAANMFEFNERGQLVGSARGLVLAVDWMVENDVHVVNMSVAGADNRVVRSAVERAYRKRLVMVAAAGNWGSETKPAYPAAYRQVIAVTAVDADHTVYRHANRGRYIDFAAPGVRIWTAVPGGGRFQSGTSFAAPFVSVLIGLEVAQGSDSQADLLRDVLKSGVIDLGEPGRDNVFGWGLVGGQPRCVS